MARRRQELTVTRRDVVEKLNVGLDFTAAGAALGISPGLAFMIATGVPADGSGVPELPTPSSSVGVPASPQTLVNDRTHNPLVSETVDTWMRTRAARELTR